MVGGDRLGTCVLGPGGCIRRAHYCAQSCQQPASAAQAPPHLLSRPPSCSARRNAGGAVGQQAAQQRAAGGRRARQAGLLRLPTPAAGGDTPAQADHRDHRVRRLYASGAARIRGGRSGRTEPGAGGGPQLCTAQLANDQEHPQSGCGRAGGWAEQPMWVGSSGRTCASRWLLLACPRAPEIWRRPRPAVRCALLAQEVLALPTLRHLSVAVAHQSIHMDFTWSQVGGTRGGGRVSTRSMSSGCTADGCGSPGLAGCHTHGACASHAHSICAPRTRSPALNPSLRSSRPCLL